MVLVFGMTVVGCNDTNPDFVEIETVTPNANLVEGVEQLFEVTVNYSFSAQQGTLTIAFNTSVIDTYTHYASVGISNGSDGYYKRP